MKYSEDYKIREWQGRHDEIERILRDLDKYDYYILENPYRCADILYEFGVDLRKRKKVIEKFLDRQGKNLY